MLALAAFCASLAPAQILSIVSGDGFGEAPA